MTHVRTDLSLASTSSGRSFLTYEPYYGLREKPFSLSSDPRFLYKSRAHASAYDDLRAGIRRREGLIVLTGDIGTGKTTLCRSVLQDLDRKTFSAFVLDPFVSREDLLKLLLIDFGVTTIDDLKNSSLKSGSRLDLSFPLYDFLRALVPLHAFAVLVIDEAQNLSQSLLEEIRILSDLEGPEKLLQVVLVGQLEFLQTLKAPHMRQLDQRVSVRCQLHGLDRDGVAGYIAHRLGVAGGRSDRVSFTDEAVDLIHRGSHGNPRVVNLICDRALHHGHLTQTSSIGSDLVRQSLNELGVTLLTPAADPMDAFRTEGSLPISPPEPIIPREAIEEFPVQHEEPSPEPIAPPAARSNGPRRLVYLAAVGAAAFILTLLLLFDGFSLPASLQ